MKLKKDNKIIIIGVVIVVILLIIAIVTSRKSDKIDYDSLTQEEIMVAVDQKIENMNKTKLSNMTERDRVEYYISSFIKLIESENYEKAYDMLYEDFKETYFPTLSTFEEYSKSKFPKVILLEHTNFERNGDIYIMWTNLSNALGSKDEKIEINFVVKENDLDDFVLSFTVI